MSETARNMPGWTPRKDRGIIAIVSCIICDHPRRFRIEKAISEGTPKARVAKDFGVSRTRLQDHIKQKHQEKNPAKIPESASQDDDIVDPFPNDHTIREMTRRSERLKHIERLIEDRRFHGSETMAKLARLWCNRIGDASASADTVADLFAEALKRLALRRGPKSIRKAFAVAELLSLYRTCRDSGDNKTAATLFAQYIELDNLKDDDSAVHKQIIAQFVQIVQVGAPHLLPRIQEVTARMEEGYEQAKAIVEGEAPPPIASLSEPEAVVDAPPTPRCEETSNAGIDTGTESGEVPSSE